MTEPEPEPGPDEPGRQPATPLPARRREENLEKKIAELESELAVERSKLKNLSSRRSVRFALRVAALAGPVLSKIRGMGRRRTRREPEEARQAALVDEILRHRAGPKQEEGPLVSIVVLNRDGAHYLRMLLPGLRDKTTYRDFELIAVDNASSDDSCDVLNADWGYPVRVIRNASNVSFSSGCNQGIGVAKGRYILLLNNDITPINPGWLGAMVGDLEADPWRGAAGALLIYPYRPGYESPDPNTGADLTIQHRGIEFRWRRNAEPGATIPWAYNVGVGEDPAPASLATSVEVPAATAACLLVRTDLIRRLGGLDEGFTYGMEDVDLALRIRQAGFRIMLVGDAAMFHHEFGTQSELTGSKRRAHGLANVQHFAEKWGPKLSRLLQLESLRPERGELRNKAVPVAVIAEPDSVVAQRVVDSLEMSGHVVALRPPGWRDPGQDPTTVLCLSPDHDVSEAPRDTLTIAWVTARADEWTGRPWSGRHDIYVPVDQQTADVLTAAGMVVAASVGSATPDLGRAILDAAAGSLAKPRIALRIDSADHVGTVPAQIAAELRKRGARAVVTTREDWENPASHCVDIVVCLSDRLDCVPNSSHVNMALLQSEDDVVGSDRGVGFDRVIVPATRDAAQLAAKILAAVNDCSWIPELALAPPLDRDGESDAIDTPPG
ncbi:MAG: glycosyltransferase family 2 protein [Acidimicrobiia bacterium]|nr:glycosyltransferase family 2 protein [Acidimicrobiia bacterium]